MKLESEELFRSLVSQIEQLAISASRQGVAVELVKAHGALYNDAHRDEDVARAIIKAAREFGERVTIVCAPGSRVEEEGRLAGLPVLLEAFADRRYLDDGSLVPRAEAEALLLDIEESVMQARSLAERGVVTARSGKVIEVACDTLTIHSDMKDSVARLRAIHRDFRQNG